MPLFFWQKKAEKEAATTRAKAATTFEKAATTPLKKRPLVAAFVAGAFIGKRPPKSQVVARCNS
jgi:hypothetical protein